jgi:hypothetical protein
LAAVGRATNSSNQTTLYLTPMHAEASLIKCGRRFEFVFFQPV